MSTPAESEFELLEQTENRLAFRWLYDAPVLYKSILRFYIAIFIVFSIIFNFVSIAIEYGIMVGLIPGWTFIIWFAFIGLFVVLFIRDVLLSFPKSTMTTTINKEQDKLIIRFTINQEHERGMRWIKYPMPGFSMKKKYQLVLKATRLTSFQVAKNFVRLWAQNFQKPPITIFIGSNLDAVSKLQHIIEDFIQLT
jgi:hypothetical protein